MTEGEFHDTFLKAKNRHSLRGKFIDYKTSMITGADPLRGLFYYDLASLTHYTFCKKEDGGTNTSISGKRAAPFLQYPRFWTTRTPGPVALAAVARQPASVRRASHLRKARFDASTSTLDPLHVPAKSLHSST